MSERKRKPSKKGKTDIRKATTIIKYLKCLHTKQRHNHISNKQRKKKVYVTSRNLALPSSGMRTKKAENKEQGTCGKLGCIPFP